MYYAFILNESNEYTIFLKFAPNKWV